MATEHDVKTLAEKIADDLFTNGAGQQAKRLVLELPGGRNGGGWCKQAVVDRIADALRAAEPPVVPSERERDEDGDLYPVLSMSKPYGRAMEWQGPLWDAIHDYSRGVGGTPDEMHVGLNGVTLTNAAARVGAAVEHAIRMGYAAGGGR